MPKCTEVVRVEIEITPTKHVSLWRDDQFVKIRLSDQTANQSTTGVIPVTHVRSLIAHGYRKCLDLELTQDIVRIGGNSIDLDEQSYTIIVRGLNDLIAGGDRQPLIAKVTPGKFVFNALQVVTITHRAAKNTCRIAVYETDSGAFVKPGVQCDLSLAQISRLLLGEAVNTGGTTVKLGSGHLWITFTGASLTQPVSYLVEPDDRYNFAEVRDELLSVCATMKKAASDALNARVMRFEETSGFSLMFGEEIVLNTGAIVVRIHGVTDTPGVSTVFIEGPMGDVRINVPTAELIRHNGPLTDSHLKLSTYGVTISVNIGNSALIRTLIQAELADDC